MWCDVLVVVGGGVMRTVDTCQTVNPCLNGATCRGVYPYPSTTCLCAAGWNGPVCQFGDICNSQPCMNGGTCDVLSVSQLFCKCVPGFTGFYW
jgi:Notch-like protein